MAIVGKEREGKPVANRRTAWWASLVALVALGMMLAACSGGNSGNSGSVQNGPTSTPNAPQHFKVGQVVKVGDTFDVTVNSVTTNAGTQFDQPGSGKTYLVVDVTLKNLTSQDQNVSSILQFTLQDTTGQKYNESITTFATPPDGQVAAGALLRGQIAYAVPTTQHQFTLAFQADLTSSGQSIWDLSV